MSDDFQNGDKLGAVLVKVMSTNISNFPQL